MIISTYRQIENGLGSDFRIISSIYDDGPPHRLKVEKRKKYKFLGFTFEKWIEVAWILQSNNIISANEEILKKIDELGIEGLKTELV